MKENNALTLVKLRKSDLTRCLANHQKKSFAHEGARVSIYSKKNLDYEEIFPVISLDNDLFGVYDRYTLDKMASMMQTSTVRFMASDKILLIIDDTPHFADTKKGGKMAVSSLIKSSSLIINGFKWLIPVRDVELYSYNAHTHKVSHIGVRIPCEHDIEAVTDLTFDAKKQLDSIGDDQSTGSFMSFSSHSFISCETDNRSNSSYELDTDFNLSFMNDSQDLHQAPKDNTETPIEAMHPTVDDVEYVSVREALHSLLPDVITKNHPLYGIYSAMLYDRTINWSDPTMVEKLQKGPVYEVIQNLAKMVDLAYSFSGTEGTVKKHTK